MEGGIFPFDIKKNLCAKNVNVFKYKLADHNIDPEKNTLNQSGIK